MKKVLTVALVLVLLILCASAFSDTEKKSGLFTYKLKGNGTAIITGFDWKSNGNQDIYIPRMIDGYNVTEIGAYAFSDKNLSEEYDWWNVGDSLMGESVNVIIPDTVTVIGEKAFFRTRIKSVPIPTSVKLIEAGAFAGCFALKSHLVDKGNETYTTINGILYNKKTKELVSFARDSWYSDKKIEIPNGIVSIGDYAFYGFVLECGIVFPDSLRSIGKSAFSYAIVGGNTEIEGAKKKLFSFNKVTEIRDYAFANVKMDGLFDFNNSQIETIGNHAFEDVCITHEADFDISFSNKESYKSILDIVFPSSLKKLGEGAFSCFYRDTYNWRMEDDRRIDIDDGNIIMNLDFSNTKITTIPDNAFRGFGFSSLASHPELPEVILPNSLEYIGKRAFCGIRHKRIRIKIPSSVQIIDNEAFYYSRIDLSFEDEAKLTTIGDKAFYDCDIKAENDTIVLPNSLKAIGDMAFVKLQYISKIVIPSSVTKLGDTICDRSGIVLLVEPESYAALYASENGYTTMDIGGEDTSWLDD